MVGGGEMKVGSAFSWADEVEKEEEEARIRTCERQRSNPFGSARPREVVLQEKGIDWRKLDQDLHRSSNMRYLFLCLDSERGVKNQPGFLHIVSFVFVVLLSY